MFFNWDVVKIISMPFRAREDQKKYLWKTMTVKSYWKKIPNVRWMGYNMEEDYWQHFRDSKNLVKNETTKPIKMEKKLWWEPTRWEKVMAWTDIWWFFMRFLKRENWWFICEYAEQYNDRDKKRETPTDKVKKIAKKHERNRPIDERYKILEIKV